MKTFENILQRSFKNVRLTKSKPNPELDDCFARKEALKVRLAEAMNNDQTKGADEITDQIETINNKISQLCADKNKKIVEDFLEHASDGIN